MKRNRSSPIIRIIPLIVSVSLTLLGSSAQAADTAATSHQPDLTATQEAQLPQRDRLRDDALRLRKEGKLEEAIPATEKMLAIERAVFGNLNEKVARTLDMLAQMHEQRRAWEAARRAREEIVAINKALFGDAHFRVTDARVALDYCERLRRLSPDQLMRLAEAARMTGEVIRLHQQGKPRQSPPLAQRVTIAKRELLGEDHPYYAQALHNEACQHYAAGEHTEAMRDFAETCAIRKRILGDAHPDYASSLERLACLYKDMGNYAKAEPLSVQVRQIRKRIFGEGHAEYATSLTDLAILYQDMTEYAKAEQLFVQVCELRKRVLGATHPDYARSLDNLAEFHMRREAWDLARRAYDQAIAVNTAFFGQTHHAVSVARLALRHCERVSRLTAEERQRLVEADASSREADLLYRRGDADKASSRAQRSVTLRKQLLGEDDLTYVTALTQLGRYEPSYLDAAEATLMRVCEIRKRVLGEDHPDYATSLHCLAEFYQLKGKPHKAEPLYVQAVEIRNRVLGEDAPETARAREDLANLRVARLSEEARDLRQRRGLKQALLVTEKVLKLQRDVLGHVHWNVANTLETLAEMHDELQALDDAQSSRAEAARIRKTIHQQACEMLSDASVALEDCRHIGLLTARLRQQLVEAAQLEWWLDAHHGGGRDDEMIARNILLAERVATIYRNVLGEDHSIYAKSLNRLGYFYWLLGEDAKAEAQFVRARDIRRKVLGEQQPDYALSLNNLAAVYRRNGEYVKAEPLLLQALDIAKRLSRGRDVKCASSLNALGDLYVDMGEYAKAEPLYVQAREIAKGVMFGESAYAESVGGLARCYSHTGEHRKAEAFYMEALDVTRKSGGEKAHRYAAVLANLTLMYLAKGEFGKAEGTCRQAMEIELNAARATLFGLSEASSMKYAGGFKRYRDLMLSAIQQHPGTRDIQAYSVVWDTRSPVTRVLVARQARRFGSRELRERLNRVRETLAELAMSVPTTGRRDGHQRLLEDLNEEKERLERELAKDGHLFSRPRREAEGTPSQLARVMPSGMAMVDMIRTVRWSPMTDERKGLQAEARYEAFVLQPRGDDYSIVRVDLGPADPIDRAITQCRETIAGGVCRVGGVPSESALKAAAGTLGAGEALRELRRLIWEKIEPKFESIHTVIVVPDGALSRVAWSALPGRVPGRYLLDDYAIATAENGQQLYARLTSPDVVGNLALLVGGVRYDQTPKTTGGSEVRPGRGGVNSARRTRSPAMDRLAAWPFLEGTVRECAAVRQDWPWPENVVVLQGASASEAALRRWMPRCRYVHLATHGFFADGKFGSMFQLDEADQHLLSRDPDVVRARRLRVIERNPLLLSGVVLAGANLPPKVDELGPRGEDGILTAEEVMGLDLQNTELLVLSACETGLGKVAGGEGILGLQRAFTLAGARTVVASLWKVDDTATALLMMRFYENLLGNRPGLAQPLPKAGALREAQQWLRDLRIDDIKSLQVKIGPAERGPVRQRPSLNVDQRAHPYEDPYYWAAFVLMGDPTSASRLPPRLDEEVQRALQAAMQAEKNGRAEQKAGRSGEALREFESAGLIWRHLASQHSAIPQFRRRLGDVLYSIGSARSELGQRRASVQAFEEAITIYEPLLRTDLVKEYGPTSYQVAMHGKAISGRDEWLTVCCEDHDVHQLGGAHCNAANALRADGAWEKAAFHYDASIGVLQEYLRQNPDAGTVRDYLKNALSGRAENYCATKDWKRAARDFAECVRFLPHHPGLLAPKQSTGWYRWALAVAAANDITAYRAICRELATLFDRTENDYAAHLVAWSAAFAPEAAEDYAPFVELADRAVAAQSESATYRTTLGGILFRVREFRGAIEQLKKAMELSGNTPKPVDQLFLAMANHCLGNRSEGKHWLDMAIRNLTTNSPDQSTGRPQQVPWNEQLEVELLRGEAVSLIVGSISDAKTAVQAVAPPPASQPAAVDQAVQTQARAAAKASSSRSPTPVEGTVTVKLQPRQAVMGSLVNYRKPRTIRLAEKPEEQLRKEPAYASPKPLYGTLQLGEGSNNRITLVLDEPEGKSPRIYVDRNNDKDLTNDGSCEWTNESKSRLTLSGITIDVPYASGAIPYTFCFYRSQDVPHNKVLHYYRDAGRVGEIRSDGKPYKILLLDDNADARFDDLVFGTLIIDLNEDGKLEGNPSSAEYHKLNEPFNIHGKVWEVTAVSPDGTSMSLRPSDARVEMKPYLDPGYSAPKFSAKDLDGNPVVLTEEAASAKCVLLYFWDSRSTFDLKGFRSLQFFFKQCGLRFIGINLDTDREEAAREAKRRELDFPHVFDGRGLQNAVAVLYRVRDIPQTFLLDYNLKIVARDLQGDELERQVRALIERAENQECPALGVHTSTLRGDVREQPGKEAEEGVVVVQVIPESPAAEAGLKEKDVISGFSGRPVKLPGELTEIVGSLTLGSTHKVTIRRDGKPLELEVRLHDWRRMAAARDQALRLVSDGDRHRAANDNTRAVAAYKTAIGMWQQLAKHHPGDPASQRGLAKAWYALGLGYDGEPQRRASIEAYETAISLYEQLRGSGLDNEGDLHELAGAHCNAARQLRQTAEWQRAAFHYDASIAVLQEHLRQNAKCAIAPRFLRNAFWGRGENSSATRQWNQAILDFSEALKLDPKVSEIHRHRGVAWAETSQWERAARDFAECTRLTPGDSIAWYYRALAAVAAKNVASYRAACKEMLDQFVQTKNASAANVTAWSAAIAPKAAEDYAPFIDLAKRAVGAHAENPNFRNTLGAILFRAGEFREAVQQFKKATELSDAGGTPVDALFLAMANHLLGDSGEAKHWLDAAIRQVTANSAAGPNAKPRDVSWSQRLEVELLRQEAEALVGAKAESAR